MADTPGETFDYVVVGSGAGGGTVAARLAEAGMSVLVLEAGADPDALKAGGLPEDYDVPAFHPFASENKAMAWNFMVHDFGDDAERRRRPENDPPPGVLYPRASTLGGCTAHNAMIIVYPHNEDWDHLATLTGDVSWEAGNMRNYFQKLENCHHRKFDRAAALAGFNPSRHGFDGWLHTEITIPKAALSDFELETAITSSLVAELGGLPSLPKREEWFAIGQGDPNDWRIVSENAYGLRYPPLSTRNHSRIGTRERLIETQEKHPANLTIELDALVTRVLFDANNRAIGVEYLKGPRLYQAHANPSAEPGEKREALCSREVILAGGAFNTPQLLMLSGIGPKGELEQHGIEVRIDLPGVGSNLQDRYEVGVVNRVKEDWAVLKGAKYAKGDPQYSMWESTKEGVYGSNGAVLAVIRRSAEERPVPDLFCFAVLGEFRGYVPGYSIKLVERHDCLTWAVLKAHTNNRAGEVRLKSADPRERPAINFKYFAEGDDDNNQDLDSVVTGVKFVRELCRPLRDLGLIVEEEAPGKDCVTDEQIRDFVRYQSWGHHASCTCPIGTDGDRNGVLDKDFRVRGTQGLRVVDASVFPRIPGMFVVSAVYMIAEKAADVILADVR
jgi:choline dehydrogenase